MYLSLSLYIYIIYIYLVTSKPSEERERREQLCSKSVLMVPLDYKATHILVRNLRLVLSMRTSWGLDM